MQSNAVRTRAEAQALVMERDIDYVQIGVFDMDAVMRGKYMSQEKFLAALEKGFGFCDVVLGWDSNDHLYDNTRFTGWHTAYPDAWVRIIPESCREIPFEDNRLLFLGEFVDAAESICPRGLLRRVLKRAEALGLRARAAFEYEFFLFDETPHSVREKQFRNLTTITPGYFGYSVLRSSVLAEFYQELLATCRTMNMALEGLHTETGPGVVEAAIAVDDALSAADKGALFKTFAKVVAQRSGWMATFMAKWSPNWPGQSGHIHISLFDKSGQHSAFFDPSQAHNISETMRHFIGGQQRLMPELLSLVACTVNSYSRLIPGFWAPTAATWGIDNRTCALRAIPGDSAAQRVEYRVAGADINPYLALAAALGSGLWGIEQGIEPDQSITGNAYAQTLPQERQLPRTLIEAAQRLRESPAAEALFGADFIAHFAATREWEEREFRKAITDWELQRYFEII